MNATTYTATGTTQTVNNADLGTVGFKPDLLWMKARSNVQNNYLSDSVRGVANILISNNTSAESNSPNFVTSFNTNGFSFGVDNITNGYTVVGWNWVAGQGVNNTNTVGSITSTVSANTTTGFSIVTYTGNGSSATVGHGLSTAPQMVIIKSRGVEDWFVYHASLGGSPPGYLKLNTTGANGGESSAIFPSAPTSTVFSEGGGSGVGANGVQHVAYCWAEVAGFSQFGSYTGNGSADGPFIYTGFRPAYVMIKRSSNAESWVIEDTARDPFNVAYKKLYANSSGAEDTGTGYGEMDILSNGFKLRASHPIQNANGDTYVYACWAENPFKFANAR